MKHFATCVRENGTYSFTPPGPGLVQTWPIRCLPADDGTVDNGPERLYVFHQPLDVA